MKDKLKYGLACFGTAFAALMIIAASGGAFAADKGAGDLAVADLEERIAELEATVVRKSNRKVRVTVSGSVNQAIIFWDDNLTGKRDARVGSNATTDTYVSFAVEARLGKDVTGGAVIELGQGAFNILADALSVDTASDVYVRRQAVWVSSPIGKLTLGKDSEATDGIVDDTSLANTKPAARMLSLRPLLGSDGFSENADLFDGQRLNGVRYDTPTIGGFKASASWSRDGTGNIVGSDVEDIWAVALRYAGEGGGFKVNAGIGYRDGAVFPGLDPLLPIGQAAFDQKTLSGSASIMHQLSGLFVNVAGGQAKFGSDKITAFEVMPGIETRLFAFGKTTFFAEYARLKVDGIDDDLSFIGGGIVQAVDPGALSLYVSARQVQLDGLGDDFLYGTAGIKIDF